VTPEWELNDGQHWAEISDRTVDGVKAACRAWIAAADADDDE
jgi:hypothetical protein